MDRVSPFYFSYEKASAKGQRSFEAGVGGGMGGVRQHKAIAQKQPAQNLSWVLVGPNNQTLKRTKAHSK